MLQLSSYSTVMSTNYMFGFEQKLIKQINLKFIILIQ